MKTIVGMAWCFTALILLSPPQRSHAGLFGTGSLEKPVKLPTEDFEKIKASAKPNENSFGADVYNGTKWNIVDIVVEISRGSEGRKFKLSAWQSDFELNNNGTLKKYSSKKSFGP